MACDSSNIYIFFFMQASEVYKFSHTNFTTFYICIQVVLNVFILYLLRLLISIGISYIKIIINLILDEIRFFFISLLFVWDARKKKLSNIFYEFLFSISQPNTKKNFFSSKEILRIIINFIIEKEPLTIVDLALLYFFQLSS